MKHDLGWGRKHDDAFLLNSSVFAPFLKIVYRSSWMQPKKARSRTISR